MGEIKSCPFCGSPGELTIGVFGEHQVSCSNKGCQAALGPSCWQANKAGAIAAWNSRVGKTKQKSVVEADKQGYYIIDQIAEFAKSLDLSNKPWFASGVSDRAEGIYYHVTVWRSGQSPRPTGARPMTDAKETRMKPVKMWAVLLDDGSHMSPPAIDCTRKEAIELAEQYVTTCWRVLKEDYGYTVRRVTVTPEP